MFKKPKRNYRANRRVDCDSDEETVESYDVDNDKYFTIKLNSKQNSDADGSDSISAELTANKSKDNIDTKSKKKKTKKGERKTVLSFEEDEDGDTETFKIKRSGHSRRIAKQLKRESKREQEEKEELKKTTTSPSKTTADRQTYERAVEDIRKLTQSDEDSSGDDQEQRPSVLQTGVIPDSRMIHEARKKRQQAREQGDYIPLEHHDDTANEKSRLVRDEDEEYDDDRVNFSTKSRENEREEIRDKILRAEHGSDSDSNHGDMWEEQQIRKAVSIPQTNGLNQQGTTESYSTVQDYIMNQSASIFNPHGSSIFNDSKSLTANQTPLTQSLGSYMGSSGPQQLPTITIEQLKGKIQQRLDSIMSVHRTHKLELNDIDSRLESCQTAMSDLALSAPKVELQYKFYQEMRAYVMDLVECLNEKVPQIDLQEKMFLSMMKSRSDRLIKRHQSDLKDQSTQHRANRTTLAGERIDSAGMDIEMQRRAAEREARRSRRRRARESRNILGHQEGTSTDEEDNTSELHRYKIQREQICHDCETMMDDIVDEFCVPADIRDRFESWRIDYSDSYQEAYITLCLPKLFNPLIRLALVTWNPLEEDCVDFETMVWYDSLILFGVGDPSTLHKDNIDIKLVPSIVEKVVVPKINDYVTEVWDPMSTQQTSRLVNLVGRIIKDYPTINDSSKQTQTLLQSVVVRIQKCLDDDVYMPLFTKDVVASKSAAAAFFQRQLWTCIKLLGNILTWNGIISSPTVKSLGLDSLLNRYIMLALHNSPVNADVMLKLQVITSTFPREWFSDMQKEGSTITQLEHLCRYLTHIAATAHQTYKDALPTIAKFLLKLKAEDNARLIITKFEIKL